jgi:hypothetical protein
MTFVEYLRVRRAVIVYTIIVACIVALALIGVFSAHGNMTVSADDHRAAAQIASAGTQRVVAAAVGANAHHAAQVGLRESLIADFTKHGTKIPLSALLFLAGFGATILGSVFASSLCRERDHTPLAWTKPVSRVQFALAYMGVDIVGMIAAFFITFVLGEMVIIWTLGLAGFISADARAWSTLALICGIALAYYGMIRALTVGFPGRGGAITGSSWAIAYVLILFTALPLPSLFHTALVAINFLNPLAYFTQMGSHGEQSGAIPLPVTAKIICVWLLAVASGAVSIFIYRRAEA